MPNQAYRLRIRNAADSADALVLTSIAGGTNPYIASPPSGDGQEVDLLTGAVRTGAYVVEVVDVATGTDGTGTIRVLTNQLNDSSASTARPHLLSRRAFVEMSTNGGSSWTAWCAGYISNIRQIDAIRYAVTVSNTRRIEQTERVFTWQSKAERDAFPKRGIRKVRAGGRTITIGGIAKGAGMIAPNMGTMLAYVFTDAALAPADARGLMREAADATFNRIIVDGDTSTNDTAALFANGACGLPPLGGKGLAAFREAILSLLLDLAPTELTEEEQKKDNAKAQKIILRFNKKEFLYVRDALLSLGETFEEAVVYLLKQHNGEDND